MALNKLDDGARIPRLLLGAKHNTRALGKGDEELEEPRTEGQRDAVQDHIRFTPTKGLGDA